ncbi:MAG: hypothetical protein ACFCUJ_13880 [Thiotrichales bacterium]
MRLERLQLELRPRNPWDAMDLGLRLTRARWRAIYLPWLAFAVTLYATLLLVFGIDNAWPSLLFWWLKPVYDRWLLHSISRAAFDDPPTLTESLRALPGLLRHTGLLRALTLARLSPARSFRLPVWQLEGLRGPQRRERLELLAARGGATPFWLTLACVHLELSIYVGPLLLAVLLAPQGIDPMRLLETLFIAPGDNVWVPMVGHLFYLLAVIVIEPIYVAAGFMLYLQRRIELEAWDLEIALRRLGTRLAANARTVLLALIIGVGGFGLTAPPASLATPGIETEARQTLDALELCETLHPTETTRVWTWRHAAPGTSAALGGDQGWIGPWLHQIARGLTWLLWLLLGIVVVALMLNRTRNSARRRSRATSAAVPPTSVRYDSAPESDSRYAETVLAASQLLDQSRTRAALALLYRATLADLSRRYQLRVAPGAAEVELIELAAPALSATQLDCLRRLVAFWSAAAYADQAPSPAHARELLTAWTQHFGAAR